MALVLADRVRETSTTTGTGAFSLGGAVTGFQSFASALSDGDTTYYAISSPTLDAWEVGLGTFDATGGTLARTTVYASSNSDAAVDWAAGPKDIFVVYPADKSVFKDASGNFSLDGAVTINESGADVDFRIESSTDANAFFLDGATGNVGVGTSSPGSATKLNVAGRGLFTGGSSDPSDGTASGVSISYDTVNNIGHIAAIQTGVATRTLRLNGSQAEFYTVGTERMRIDSSGNVGIGTSSIATGKLQINSSASAYGGIQNTFFPAGTSLYLRNNDGTSSSANLITMLAWGNTSASVGYFGAVGNDSGLSANLVFGRRTGTSTYAESMRIDSNGRVGIGTSSPGYKAEIVGGADESETALLQIRSNFIGTNTATTLRFANSTGVDASQGTAEITAYRTNTGTSGATDLIFRTSEGATVTEKMRIDSSGNVGIGTTSPSTLLHVAGGDFFVSRGSSTTALTRSITIGGARGATGNAYALLNFRNYDSSSSAVDYTGASISAQVQGTSADGGELIFSTSASTADPTERMRITSAGNVGIGTSSPSTKLHVAGDTTFGGAIDETVYNLTGTALDPSNGTIQYKTLSANTTLTDSLAEGESITLMIDDGSAYTITWPTMTWVNNGGSAPTLATTGYTTVALWKVSTTLYGALVGNGE